MKKRLCSSVLLLGLGLHVSAQIQDPKGYNSWLSIGVGKTISPMQTTLTNYRIAYMHKFGTGNVLGFHWDYGFGKGFIFEPHQIAYQKTRSVTFGKRERLRNNLFFTPSIGLGYSNIITTKYYQNEEFEQSFISKLFFDMTGKQVYQTKYSESVCVPVALNFMLTTRVIGLEGGIEMLVMKYPYVGAHVSLCIGKMFRRNVNVKSE